MRVYRSIIIEYNQSINVYSTYCFCCCCAIASYHTHTHLWLVYSYWIDTNISVKMRSNTHTHTHESWPEALAPKSIVMAIIGCWRGKGVADGYTNDVPVFLFFFIIILFVQIFVQTTLPSSPPKGTLSFHVAQKAFPTCVCVCNPSSYVHSYSHSKREIQFLCGQESILLLLTHTVWFFPHTHTHKNLIDWILLSILNRFFFWAVLIVQCLQCPGIPFFSQKGEAKLSDYIKMAAFCVCVCLSKRIERLCVIYTFEQMVFKKI